MFAFALLVLLVSYEVFFIGVLGFLQSVILSVIVLTTISACIIWQRNTLVSFAESIFHTTRSLSRFQKFLIALVTLQFVINAIGAFVPELGFDALWYHLTLPKLYLIWGSVRHIPGGLLYYSDMPKLGEMLYTLILPIKSVAPPEIIQLFFGLFTTMSLYFVSRKYFSKTTSFLVAVIFYANLVVAWESTTAYIDLIRTFYEFLALWAFLLWDETDKKRWFFLAAICVGAAITTKVLALSSLAIFLLLTIFIGEKKHLKFSKMIIQVITFTGVALCIPLPWFIFSFIHTGNPFYPIFSPLYKTPNSMPLVDPLRFISDSWHVLTHADDPINSIYLIFLPLILILYKKFTFQLKIITLYSLLGFISWYAVPQTGGGRFLLAYLPAFSLTAGSVFQYIEKNKILTIILTASIVFISIISIGYRGIATARYLPVILGQETKSHFLTTHLNFSFGDFYDTDNYFATHIKPRDRVLLFGFHNLYYVDFLFIDSSWVQNGDRFDYIATQHMSVPGRFSHWQLIYVNPVTGVKLYTDQRKIWRY